MIGELGAQVVRQCHVRMRALEDGQALQCFVATLLAQ
jgi:hypothetical protein